jgi:magnesium-transporting ATPase (P-type)
MTSFIFQKKRFIYDEKTGQFQAIVFPIDSSPKLSLFQNSHGIATQEALEHAEKDYGFNRFDIPIPGFKELFKEHAVAPFFVFQIFCVGLWCLDEYWYYSLFTGFMLIMFESTVVWQVPHSPSEHVVDNSGNERWQNSVQWELSHIQSIRSDVENGRKPLLMNYSQEI